MGGGARSDRPAGERGPGGYRGDRRERPSGGRAQERRPAARPGREPTGRESTGAPERERGPQRERQTRPPIPEEVTGAELDKAVRAELSGLHPGLAKEVAQRLVLAGELLDEDPERAYLHAAAARERAARIPAVREAVGLAAYRTGRYAEALAELRTVRRLTGSNEHLPVMADCERGLGRPERALEMLRSPQAAALDAAGRVELLVVAAGARADLGERDAAVVTLQVPQLRATTREPWLARLQSAYADALAAVGRDAEARDWLERAAGNDEDGSTGAAERLAELEGIVFIDEVDEVEVEVEVGEEVGEVEVGEVQVPGGERA